MEDEYRPLLERFVHESRRILGDLLVGVYLHGSAAMGCFNREKSDLDLIVVVSQSVPDAVRRRYLDMCAALDRLAPPKGLELSVVRGDVCMPFVYPTPFEIHFSPAHLDWYRSAPEDHIQKMRGVDKDLAAHFMIVRHRGRVLWGREIDRVFGEVGRREYLDSIRNDVNDAAERIEEDPAYAILNLCRVLAYKRDGLILSKREGGTWGLSHVPGRFHGLIAGAMSDYEGTGAVGYDRTAAKEFARYMLDRIEEA